MLNPKNLLEVKQFVHHVIFDLDVNFHPDTDFHTYIDKQGNRTFDEATAEQLNAALTTAFAVCDSHGADIYELTMPMLEERLFA